MITATIDAPKDAALGPLEPYLQPETVLEACRDQLTRIDPAVRQSWQQARFVEALYHPQRYLRVVYALLDDPTTPAERLWPQGQLIYLHLPPRKPMSGRGTLITVAGAEVEAFRFPNDRRLRGLRKFTGKEAIMDFWHGWLDESTGLVRESLLAPERLDPATLQRLFVRYVPEQKWVVRLRADVAGARGDSRTSKTLVKRRIAVRSASPEACALLGARHTAGARWSDETPGAFRIPDVVGLDVAEGLLAVEWIRGESLLSTLVAQGERSVMPALAERLHAFHTMRMDGLAPISRDDLIDRARHAVDDLTAACPELAQRTQAVGCALVERLSNAPHVESVTLHNDFHWNQVSIKRDRWVLLDLERMALGDPLIDVGTFTAQIEMLGDRPEHQVDTATARRWASAFLDHWAGLSSSRTRGDATRGGIDAKRLATYAALARLELARGMMRHLREGWRELAYRCLERAGADLRGGSGLRVLP